MNIVKPLIAVAILGEGEGFKGKKLESGSVNTLSQTPQFLIKLGWALNQPYPSTCSERNVYDNDGNMNKLEEVKNKQAEAI